MCTSKSVKGIEQTGNEGYVQPFSVHHHCRSPFCEAYHSLIILLSFNSSPSESVNRFVCSGKTLIPRLRQTTYQSSRIVSRGQRKARVHTVHPPLTVPSLPTSLRPSRLILQNQELVPLLSEIPLSTQSQHPHQTIFIYQTPVTIPPWLFLLNPTNLIVASPVVRISSAGMTTTIVFRIRCLWSVWPPISAHRLP